MYWLFCHLSSAFFCVRGLVSSATREFCCCPVSLRKEVAFYPKLHGTNHGSRIRTTNRLLVRTRDEMAESLRCELDMS